MVAAIRAFLRRARRPAVFTVALGILLGVFVAAVAVLKHHRAAANSVAAKLPSAARRIARYERAVVLVQENRKVYPYSIVPGGAASLAEAKLMMNRPDLHAIYADVNVAKLHPMKLDKDLSGYVSYRYQDKIYWTARKLTLRAGETVYTDGSHVVRARCLNRYSALPMSPTRPKEPSPKVMDTFVDVPIYAYKFPVLPIEEPELPAPPEELTPTVPVLPTSSSATATGTRRGGFWFPLIPIIPPIHRRRHKPPPGVNPPPTSTPPIVPPVSVVPEPNYFWLLLVACFALGVAGVRKRRAIKVPNSSTE